MIIQDLIKKIRYLLATLKFEQQIPDGNRTCLMWPKISLKLKDFPPKKNLKDKKKKKKKKSELELRNQTRWMWP